MAPSPNLDFASIMADLTQFQHAIGRICSQLTDPRQKEVLGEALGNVAKARVDVEATYPKTIKLIDDRARQTIQEGEATLRQIREKKQWLEQAKQQAAQGGQTAAQVAGALPAAAGLAAPPAIAEQAAELHPAAQLRDELLTHFLPQGAPRAASPVKIDREIWQDWTWGEGQPTM